MVLKLGTAFRSMRNEWEAEIALLRREVAQLRCESRARLWGTVCEGTVYEESPWSLASAFKNPLLRGELVLSATRARIIDATSARFQASPDRICDWVEEKARVAWTAYVNSPGVYNVSAFYSCKAMGTLLLKFGNNSLELSFPSLSKGSGEEAYAWQTFGSFHLGQGYVEVVLCKPAINAAIIELRAVTLRASSFPFG